MEDEATSCGDCLMDASLSILPSSAAYLKDDNEEADAQGRIAVTPSCKSSSAEANIALANLKPVSHVMLWNAFTMACGTQTGWIQLAGHEGTFVQNAMNRTILKKHSCQEQHSLEAVMLDDRLRPYVPKYYGVVSLSGIKYVEMQDLLADFYSPAIIDCKIGIRTYLEDEVTKDPEPRKDMYKKMVAVDPSEPTSSEHKMGAVTKARYMQWRDHSSSTATFGFRIDALRKANGLTATIDFKKTIERAFIVEELREYADNNRNLLARYLERLLSMRLAMDASDFIARHEIIGSSLLFVHDATNCGVWVIDFAKAVPVETTGSNVSITHRRPWLLGNREDGYLTGIDNLIEAFAEAVSTST